MRRHGVDLARLAVLHGVRTGAADVFVDESGENFIVIEPGANVALSPAAVEDALLALEVSAGDVVLTSGEISAGAVAAAAEQARCAGATHVHNLAPFRPLEHWGDGEHLVLVANALEARQATAVADPTASAIRLASGRRAALVTLGAQGALLAIGGKVLSLTAPQVTAVDTTGAGDALCGAFAAALSLGIELSESAALAVRAGAVAVTGAGARGALADLANLRESHGRCATP
jgi:ribokinase